MRLWWASIFSLIIAACGAVGAPIIEAPAQKVFILPIREDIMPPLVYVVRRGVKEAMDAKADLLVVDMDTNGGRVDATEEIMEILNKYPGQTLTYVNRKAFSAGALISVATGKIYMAPQSVIGAAAPIMLTPGGTGAQDMPSTMEAKMTSALRALVRTSAEKNGHNIAVIEAMIDKSRELKIGDEVLNEKGQILTLTDTQAAKKYGNPPKPLLSAGTVGSLDDLLSQLGHAGAERHQIKATGAEKLGTWLNAISPLLLIIGIVGLYIEFKTPGFGVPGVVGILAFALYFLGGYVAGLSGWEWVLVFLLGLALVITEFFVFPGTFALGLAGVGLILVALIMAMADIYPTAPAAPGLPRLPTLTWEAFQRPMQILIWAALGSIAGVVVLSRFLPKTPIYRTLVSESASGAVTEAVQTRQKLARQGQIGVTISTLRPGGKAQFGDDILDVISQGEMVPKGVKVQIIDYSGNEPVVAVVE